MYLCLAAIHLLNSSFDGDRFSGVEMEMRFSWRSKNAKTPNQQDGSKRLTWSLVLLFEQDEKTWPRQRKHFEGHSTASSSIPLHLCSLTSTSEYTVMREGGGGGRDSLGN